MGKKKGKGPKGPKGPKITLKIAKKAIRITQDGKRRLVLCNLGITQFPKCLFKMTNVEQMDLSRNLLQKLPDNIGQLKFLKWLDLHTNKLDSLPESMGNMENLTYLNIANNALTFLGLPVSLGSLSNLTCLILGLNQLDDLPPALGSLENLQELGLFDNKFVRLPGCVGLIPTLTKINVKRNPMDLASAEGQRPVAGKDDIYLIHKRNLCCRCLRRCKAQKERHAKGLEGDLGDDGDLRARKKKGKFPGLSAPNSIAILSQNEWRIKKATSEEEEPPDEVEEAEETNEEEKTEGDTEDPDKAAEVA